MRGVNNTCGNSGGVERGVIAVFTKWEFRGEGGLTRNSLCGGGMDIFWNYT